MKFEKKNKSLLYVFLGAVSLIIAYKLIDHIGALWEGVGAIFSALKPFIIGSVIAYLLNQPTNAIARKYQKSRWSYLKNHAKGLSVLSVYSIIVIAFVLIVRIIVPALYKNIVDLFNNLPIYAERCIILLNNIQERFGIWLINTESFSLPNAIKFFIKTVDINQFGKYAEGIISATSGLINSFIALIVSIYICLDKETIGKSVKRVVSIIFLRDKSENIFEYVAKTNDIFTQYIYCKLLEALIMTLFSTLALTILGIRYSLILGIVIGIFSIIPYFGSIISTVISVIITIFSTGIFPAIWTCAALLVLEQIDGNFIGPKIIGDKLNMRPLWVIFAVTVGGGLFGMIGLLLSVPVLMVIKMIISDLLNERERKLMK